MMNNTKYKYLLAAYDWISLSVAFIVSIYLHRSVMGGLVTSSYPFLRFDILVFMIYAFIGIVIFQYNNLYNIDVVLSTANQSLRLLVSVIYLVIGYSVFSFFSKSGVFLSSRLVLLMFVPISMSFLIIERMIIFQAVLKFLVKLNLYQRRVAILGAGKMAKLLAANLSWDNPYGVQLVGFVDHDSPEGIPVFKGLKTIGKIADIEVIAKRHNLDEIVLCVENIDTERLMDLLESCMKTGAQVKIASPIYDIVETFRFIERYGEIPVVGISQKSLQSFHEFAKRMFDVVFAVIGMIMLLPVFIVMAIVIKLDSSGPVFYNQVRVGKNGKQFKFYKFRSMVVGSDQDETRKEKVAQLIRGELWENSGCTKIVDESKITRIGRFIRKTSLDELPQLFNVLIGDMSLVGPRPCLPYEWEHYEDWQKKRLACMPGCTGVWQVSGRNAISFNDMVILDFYYIQNASLFLDLQLILKTIPVMVFGKGGK
jgi:exopolysaccharide biosynthesis polyprenyl glycosylphosphotransferase